MKSEAEKEKGNKISLEKNLRGPIESTLTMKGKLIENQVLFSVR